MITVRALHDGIFAVSTISDDGEDDCPPPRSPSCRSCLLWIVGQAYVCADCERTYCNAGCASSERHRCAGRQTAIDKLPCKEPHEKRMRAARAYDERQKLLAADRVEVVERYGEFHRERCRAAALKRWHG